MAFDARALGAQAMADNRAYRARSGGFSPFAPSPPTVPQPQQNLAPAQAQPTSNMVGTPAMNSPLGRAYASAQAASQAGGTPMVTALGAGGTPGSLTSGLGAMYSQAQQAARQRLSPNNTGTATFGQGWPGTPTGSLSGPATGGLAAGSYGAGAVAPNQPPTQPSVPGLSQTAANSSLPRPDWINRYLGSDNFQQRNVAMNWLNQNKNGTAPDLANQGGPAFWSFYEANRGR